MPAGLLSFRSRQQLLVLGAREHTTFIAIAQLSPAIAIRYGPAHPASDAASSAERRPARSAASSFLEATDRLVTDQESGGM